jgi:predicted GIY-YIG superfamily endonuclease
MGEVGIERKEVAAWIGQLPPREKDKILTSLVVDADQTQVTDLLQRLTEHSEGHGKPVTTGRTVGELLRAAEEHASERSRAEAERRAKEKARRDREAAIAREKHLDSLTGRESKLWGEIDAFVASKQPKSYDQAVAILVDLRDLAARGKAGEFGLRIEALREAQARKPSFIQRLAKAGL